MRRPASIAAVATWSNDASAFWYNLMDFVDEFRRLRDVDMLSEEPAPLRERFDFGPIADAYLAAVAVSLAREIGATPPTWSASDTRTLERPWFAQPGAALRAMLLAESPAPFRERNLFVSANALSRA